MKHLRTAGVWCLLLNKRFLKKPAFLVILALIPLLLLSLRGVTAVPGGKVNVVLCPAEGDGGYSQGVVDELMGANSVIGFRVCDDPERARAMVIDGDADAAWIFRADAPAQLARYGEGGRGVAVTAVERENNVFLAYAREKLYAALFPRLSHAYVAAFLWEITGDDTLTGETLDAYYPEKDAPLELIEFSFAGAEERGTDDYLVSPARGLLAVLLMLGGMAAALFLAQDRDAGDFVLVSRRARPWLAAAYVLLPVLDLALAVYAALALSGLMTSWPYELLLLLLLAVSGAGFAALVGRIFRSPRRIGVAALLLTICMMTMCPVFLNSWINVFSYLFPPFYYLHGVYNPLYALWLAVYAAAVWAVYAALAVTGKT